VCYLIEAAYGKLKNNLKRKRKRKGERGMRIKAVRVSRVQEKTTSIITIIINMVVDTRGSPIRHIVRSAFNDVIYLNCFQVIN